MKARMFWLIFICIVIAVFIALMIVANVMADDNDIGICTDPNSVNYPGVETLNALKEAGLNPVNDGSCYYLQCDEVMMDDGTGMGAYSCDMGTPDHQNYMDWVNDRLPGMQYGPAYYGKLIDVGGCTDPEAVNFTDAQWFPDYNIIDDGSCVYPEPENAL
jgi:hypothetical protein